MVLLNRMLSRLKRLSERRFRNSFKLRLQDDPMNGPLHAKFANRLLNAGDNTLAFAELKTAEFLGVPASTLEPLKRQAEDRLPPTHTMDHNVIFRLRELADAIRAVTENKRTKVLDVGGGHGQLAQFLPDYDYCLAEPSVNAISGSALPFPNGHFDVTVACHVLEHIPPEDREVFLDNLVEKSRKAIILNNPFHIAKTNVTGRLKLIIEITDAEWAKEHLECSLPTVESVETYANSRGLRCVVQPSGTSTTSLALVFAKHFALQAGCNKQLRKINAFFNDLEKDVLNSPNVPNAYMITLHKE